VQTSIGYPVDHHVALASCRLEHLVGHRERAAFLRKRMILDTPCALCSSSSTRSRNGRVPDFELLSRPTDSTLERWTRLANGTAFPAITAAGNEQFDSSHARGTLPLC